MTLPSTPRRAGPFTGTGVLLSYPFTFKVFAKEDLQVVTADTNGLETTQVIDSGALVTLNADQDATPGGSVQYAVGAVPTALPTGYRLAITGAGLDYDQPADLPQGGAFNAENVEDAFDRTEMQIQNLLDTVNRSVTVGVTSSTTLALPAPVAGQLLGWNSTLDGLVNYAPDASSAAGLQIRLANPASVVDGDALVAVNNGDAGEVGRTLHYWIKASRRNLCNFLLAAEVDDILAGTGSIDVAAKFTTAMQAAAAAGGSRGAYLDLPQGLIKVGSAVAPGNVSRVWVEGQGSATRVQTSNATADIFTLGDSTNECSGFVFSDFDVWSSAVKSAGYAFNNRIATDSQWRNVNVGSNDLYTAAGAHRLFRGWYFDRFDTVSVYGGQCVTSSDGVQARGIIGDTYGAELVLDGNLRFFRQNAAGAAAVRIGGCCGGVYLRRMDASLATYGLVIDTTLVSGGVTATKRNREIFVEGANFDSCKKWGIQQVAESVALLVMDKPWAASCGTDDDGSGGVFLGGGATVVPQVVMGGAPFIYNNVGPGVHAENGGYISIDGGQITQNGTSASGGHGVEFGVTFPTRFSMTGTDIALNGKVAKGYAIDLPAGMNNFTLIGLGIYSNLQGTINNAAGFSATQIIRDCVGYLTENSGVATVANGTSSIAVNHGLAVTPATVLISAVGAPSVGTYSAGAFGATTFTIDNGAVAAGARQFSWRAVVSAG